MADIRPFAAIRYARGPQFDASAVIAPPYDVLDDAGKAALLAKSPNNIVEIDLPFMPPKSVGPDAVYEKANATLQSWLSSGILEKDRRPGIYPYTQVFETRGRTYHRRGFICLVRLEEFNTPQHPTNIVPHEKTYKGPIEDRMKLMRATSVQLSPIFGLFPDDKHEVNKLLYASVGKPEVEGTLEGVRHQLWSIHDAQIEHQVIDLMKRKKIYIADGHHRYTTALGYKAEMEAKLGGKLPADHPANFCLFVLVSMHDDGCLILPTHRLLGGLKSFDIVSLQKALGNHFKVEEAAFTDKELPQFEDHLASSADPIFGLFDGKTRKTYTLKLINQDVLKPFEPGQSDAWRGLDVAILQRYLLDEIISPTFAPGMEIKRGYTADPSTLARSVDGIGYQIALLLRPTPLKALEELGKFGEVMPQKSTYFYPKLATGIAINPIASTQTA